MFREDFPGHRLTAFFSTRESRMIRTTSREARLAMILAGRLDDRTRGSCERRAGPSRHRAVQSVRSDGKYVQAVMYPQQPGMAFLEATARRLAYLLPCANTSNTSRGKAYVERCGFRSSSDEGER